MCEDCNYFKSCVTFAALQIRTILPTAHERVVRREKYLQPNQRTGQQTASKNRNQFSSLNKGHPTPTTVNRSVEHGLKPQSQKAIGNTWKPLSRQTNITNTKSTIQRPTST